ncbi:uncharacterized protein NECHADRAFT_106390 [Fusarium vanettenii 77-13-4]|uniref:pectin lyase n=1 Tax=Fusarium vanettenii (strain ATCC MYA-4622 / CBS 123669 / FGSC 9596 / NRRL 45880 / 77-13-4) TaxID=660122 RepID=C7YVE4_FUSV7|nr:uncharacterized protein NECHADRAFT_106390 [Fusarium vanettenii 77-13-4]EEU44572.1 hypothetical protein NECHADRAFT_106390 [Fusarium vanettenii 77-13-4]
MLAQVASVLLAAASVATAQSIVGTAYGFASGVTGGGAAAAAIPSSVEQLAEWLSDDTERVIVIDKEYDFTGTTATGAGCDRISCSSSNGGQLYLGDLSCGGSDNTAVSSISYDTAGTTALPVGSNKSIIGTNGKGVLKGKGLSLQKGASNVIIQGIEFTDINPGIVWGGDALDLQGGNDGVWVDHCKFSLVGRMFVVSHYDGSRLTLSNNEFDGVTTTSASCNGNHYWTMMFIGEGDQVTLDKNYFHDVSGRAPKLGADGVTCTFQASNNLFSNMKGHAFDGYNGATALIEGNAFESVNTPITESGASVSTFFNVPDESAAGSCESSLGRACAINSVDSSSGDWPSLSGSGALSTWSNLKEYLVEPVAASEVSSLVKGGAGPANLGTASSTDETESDATEPSTAESSPAVEEAEKTENAPAAAATSEAAAPVETAPVETAPAEAAPVESAPAETGSDNSDSDSGSEVAQWGQCGGLHYIGPTQCASGTSCVAHNDYYSQCVSSATRRMKRALRAKY